MGRETKPTISDVARSAGVSPASVSRVLNNVHPLSEDLKRAVTEAAEKLGYRHRRAEPRYNGSLAVIVPDTMNSYFHEIALGVEEEAVGFGMLVNLVLLNSNAGYAERLARWLSRGFCDGVIYCSSGGSITDKALIHLHEEAGIPVVLINRNIAHPGIPAIRINFVDAMSRATQHLLKLNHRKIACFSGPPESTSSTEKRRGVERAISEAGLTIAEDNWLVGGPTVEWGYHNMGILLDRPERARPSAVLAFNDLLALGAMHACKERRVRVPEDVSIVGFDDVAMAAHADPPLTTIASPKAAMGKLAAQMVHAIRTRGQAGFDHYTMMESPLIVRESTVLCRRT